MFPGWAVTAEGEPDPGSGEPLVTADVLLQALEAQADAATKRSGGDSGEHKQNDEVTPLLGPLSLRLGMEAAKRAAAALSLLLAAAARCEALALRAAAATPPLVALERWALELGQRCEREAAPCLRGLARLAPEDRPPLPPPSELTMQCAARLLQRAAALQCIAPGCTSVRAHATLACELSHAAWQCAVDGHQEANRVRRVDKDKIGEEGDRVVR